MKKDISYYEINYKTLDVHELRTYNRYYLHPKNKRMCNQCRIIYCGIPENFHIKKYTESGISWNVKCKYCFNSINKARIEKYRKDYKMFIKSKLSAYRNRAEKLGVPFNLDSDYLITLFEKQEFRCYYSNEKISFENVSDNRLAPHRSTPSLDRMYPKDGYTKGNVVWCSYFVNRMKNDTPLDEFYDLCRCILENLNNE